MPVSTLERFDGTRVGLIVRGKQGERHEPGVMQQHADCILPDGSPIGFFGNAGGASSPSSSGSLNSTGMNMIGFVADYNGFQRIRPFYVDAEMAARYRMISTVLLIGVTAEEAKKFREYWTRLKMSPGAFNLLGDNCSTHASDAFRYAGITKGGIPGLDTPNNLYKQIRLLRGPRTASYTGYVGFKPRSGTTGFDLIVDPVP